MSNHKKGKHVPVLTKEAIQGLNVQKGKQYIDATVGDAGHAARIIKKGGLVLAIDWDPGAVKRAKQRLKEVFLAPNQVLRGPTQPFICVVGNFKNLAKIAGKYGFGHPAGILFDLGVSSPQLEDPKRGLSFTKEGALDMRLDPSLKRTAKDLINELSQEELYEIFTRNAQEELARPISKAIVRARRLKPVATTVELAEIVRGVAATRRGRHKLHPATKVFLALRIEVNEETANLKEGVFQAIDLLRPEGRLVVISFHETEDRIVKHALRKGLREKKLTILTRKPMTTSMPERRRNPRARSAKLRIAERL